MEEILYFSVGRNDVSNRFVLIFGVLLKNIVIQLFESGIKTIVILLFTKFCYL